MRTLASPRDKAEILRRLKMMDPDSASRWGRMSAHQMICHLCDSFRMVTGQKTTRPGSSVLHRTVVKWIALYAPLPWPPGIRTSPEIDQEIGGTSPCEFAADVLELEALVEQVTAGMATYRASVHPLFGTMSDAAWLRWGYLHMDHHLRQFGA